jgi:hypothetical protein
VTRAVGGRDRAGSFKTHCQADCDPDTVEAAVIECTVVTRADDEAARANPRGELVLA